MGNRAFVIFTDKAEQEISPAVYLHWNGGPESVYAFLAELDRREVRADQDYEAARFVSIVAEFFDGRHYTTLSLGIRNGPDEITESALNRYNHGDNGVYVVCREGQLKVRRFIPKRETRGLRELSDAEVATEKKLAVKHEYNTGSNPIAARFRNKPTEAEFTARR